MSRLDEPAAPPVEPELDLRRHPRTASQPIRFRDWARFTRGEGCPLCGERDTRPSHHGPWWAGVLGLHSRRCRTCRTLFAQVRLGDMFAAVVLAVILLGLLAEGASRLPGLGLRGGGPPAAGKGSGQLPPPVMR